MIRSFRIEDGDEVRRLLALYNLCPLSDEEFMSGLGIVYELDSKIVGFMWGIVSGKIAVIDYLVVDENYRHKDERGRTVVGLDMASHFMATLVVLGVTKFIGIMDKTSSAESMLRFYRKLGMVERVPFAVVKGSPSECLLKVGMEE